MRCNLAERVPCLGVLHVVCAGKAVMVPLLLALACCACVSIFDVKAAHVAHVLVHVPFSFVCIHFVGGALSCCATSWMYGTNCALPTYGMSTCGLPLRVRICVCPDCIHRLVLPCVHALKVFGAWCSTLVDGGVMLGVGRSVVGCVWFVAV